MIAAGAPEAALRNADPVGEGKTASALLALNTASAKELERLPGVGKTIALRIVQDARDPQVRGPVHVAARRRQPLGLDARARGLRRQQVAQSGIARGVGDRGQPLPLRALARMKILDGDMEQRGARGGSGHGGRNA